MKPTKAQTGKFLELVFQIIDGEFKGRKCWSRLNLDNPNAQAVKIARGELSAICRAVGVMQPKDSVELHDKPLAIKVGLEKRKDTGEFSNTIKGYEKTGGAGTAAPQPVAAGGPGTPPWQKN